MAYLTWIRHAKLLLKVQEGTGDNLIGEDIANGFVDYVLWSTFRPADLGLDGELTFECVDGGMVLFREELLVPSFISTTLSAAYAQAFNRPYSPADCELLWSEDDPPTPPK